MNSTPLGEGNEMENEWKEQDSIANNEEPDKVIETESERDNEADDVLDESQFFEQQLEQTVVNYEEGDIIKGIIRKIENAGIMVDINYKSDGFVPNTELSVYNTVQNSEFEAGQEIDVCIMKLETKEGYTILSRKRAEYELAWNHITQIAKTKDTIDVKVVSKVQGGLVSEYKTIRGFIPASHVLKSSDDSLDGFIGNELSVVVLQADRKRRKVIFSFKLARVKQQKPNTSKVIETIEVGEVKQGTVSSIKDFGAFIDIGGIRSCTYFRNVLGTG
jgi:ribosomal protein S1